MLLSLPTGSGKSIIMGAIAKQFNKKTLIIAHREELITQNVDKIRRYWAKADIGIVKAEKNELDHQIIVASVQTCNQPERLKQLKKRSFGVLMIDECHHANCSSYLNIIKELGFGEKKKKLLIGVTATPSRNDKKALSDIFKEVAYSVSIDTLIKTGYLVPVFARRILTDLRLKGVKTVMGDFAVGELSEAVNIPARNAFIVSKFKEHATGRKTIAFCVDVKHCHDLTEEFNKQGIVAAAIWGSMDSKLRAERLIDFKNGLIQVLTSCGVLTEGYDEPTISCIISARPTKSQILYSQQIGRGLRIDPNPNTTKKDCLVLDFTDQHNNLKTVVSLGDIIPSATIISDEMPKAKTRTTLTLAARTIASDKKP